MKHTIQKILAVFASGVILLSATSSVSADRRGTPIPHTAVNAAVSLSDAAKEEVVYAKLNSNGAAGEVYVINAFTLETAGQITDYGDYDSVLNLTTTNALTLADGKVTGEAPSGRFYYQGNLNKANLPWIISIIYFLDGKEITAGELAGASGQLEIQIGIRENPDVNPIFFDNYSLQISMYLNTDLCRSVESPGATIASSGKDKVITFIKLPGNDGNYVVRAEVSAFEMSGIQVSGVPLSLDVKLPDTSSLTDGLADLQEGISKLNDGAQTLDTGSTTLSDGTGDLSDGLQSMQSGMDDVKSGFYQLISGNPDLTEGSAGILTALQTLQGSLDAFGTMPTDISGITQGSSAISTGINQLDLGLQALSGSFVQTDTAISSQTGYASLSEANTAVIASLTQQISALSADPQTNAEQIAQYTQIVTLLSTNDQLLGGLEAAINGGGVPEDPGLVGGADALALQYSLFDEGIQELPAMITQMADAITALKAGIDQIAIGYGDFDVGLAEYTDGTSSLYSGYSDLCDGFDEVVNAGSLLSDGAAALSDGASSLAGGTNELNTQTSTMEADAKVQLDDLLSAYTAKEFDIISFVSDKNTNVASVQFIMITDEIKMVIPETIIQEPESKTFLDRLTELFS